jgi:hypothetical protein
MDQLAQRSLVGSISENFIETGGAQAAQRAATGFIQRETIGEGYLAGNAVELGRERFRFFQAALADGDSGNFAERFVADATIIGEEEVEQAADCLLRCITSAVVKSIPTATKGKATREDPPPPNTLNTSSVPRVGLRFNEGPVNRKCGGPLDYPPTLIPAGPRCVNVRLDGGRPEIFQTNLLEVFPGQLRVRGNGPAPDLFRFVVFPGGLQGVAEVKQGIRKIGTLFDGDLIAFRRQPIFARRLQQQAEVIRKLHRTFPGGK